MWPILLRVAECALLEEDAGSCTLVGGVGSRGVSGTRFCGRFWCSLLNGVGDRWRLGVVDRRSVCVRVMIRTSDCSGPYVGGDGMSLLYLWWFHCSIVMNGWNCKTRSAEGELIW